MATIMGIAARNKEISLAGMRLKIGKEMSSDLPRRIIALPVEIWMPVAEDDPAREFLKNAALSCPVNESIHPDIEVSISWNWSK